MFLEGLAKMYVEDPAKFWEFIACIAPTFTVGVLFGLIEESRELNGKYTSGWRMWKAMIFLCSIGVAWTCVMRGLPFVEVPFWHGIIALGLCMFVMMFPAIGGVMTGLWLMKAYWFVIRGIHWIRNPNPE